MGCLCPTGDKHTENEYHIMTSDQPTSHIGNDELEKNCQRIDIEDDDYFEKPNKVSVTRNLNKKYISISDFTVNKIIGRGGFGKVLLVEKKDDGKLFAMKVIKKDMVAQRNQKIHTLA